MPIRESQQVYIRWENINYYVRETKWTNLFSRNKQLAYDYSMSAEYDQLDADGLMKARDSSAT